jgi:hypothetical protein
MANIIVEIIKYNLFMYNCYIYHIIVSIMKIYFQCLEVFELSVNYISLPLGGAWTTGLEQLV